MKQINYTQEPLNHVPRSVIYWVSQGLVIGGNRHSIREFRIEDNKLKLITEFEGKFYEHEVNSSGSNSGSEDHGKEQQDGEFTYDELLKYMMRKTNYKPEELYQTADMEATIALTNRGEIDDPYRLNVVSERDLEELELNAIYNNKFEFFSNRSNFDRVITPSDNIYYGDTLLPYDRTTKIIDLSKLKNKKVFQLVIK